MAINVQFLLGVVKLLNNSLPRTVCANVQICTRFQSRVRSLKYLNKITEQSSKYTTEREGNLTG